MIVLEQYGVRLTRLQKKDIELVRYWRNQADITNYMEYRNYITPTNQLKWFESINNSLNYYFIIEYCGNEIGLINIRDIDFEIYEGEAGIFIYDDDCLNSTISFQASFCLYDFCFEKLKLNRVIAHILKDNRRAIKYNKMIGYRISDNQGEINNQLYFLNKVDYFIVRDEFIPILNTKN